MQYNSADRSFSSNLRLRWEYSPGSELFVVYTDDRDVTGELAARPGLGTFATAAWSSRINRLFRP